MTLLNFQTDNPFNNSPRLHHCADEMSFQGPSSAGFGRRNLVGLMGVMIGGASAPAPWTPTENAYIETDSVSYIDTGYFPSKNMEYEVELQCVDTKTDNSFMMCSYSSALTGTRFRICQSASSLVLSAPATDYGNIDRSLSAYRSRRIYKLSGGKYYIGDGEAYINTAVSDAVGNMCFGASCGKVGANSTRIFHAKFIDGGVVFRDMYPYSGDRGIGLLDIVNNILYGNASSSGVLTYGIAD